MARAAGVDGRREILEAASRLFYEQGVDAVSVDQVATAAGFTKRALYYHFPSKDALIHAWLRAADGPSFALLRAAAASGRSTAAHPVERVIESLGAWMRTPRFHGCAFLNASRDRPGDATVMTIARTNKANTIAWLETIAGEEQAPDPALRARQYLMLLDSLLATGHLYPPDELVRTASSMLAAILATPDPDCSTKEETP